MEIQVKAEGRLLWLPVKAGKEKELLEIFWGEEKIFEFMIPADFSLSEDYRYDYLAPVVLPAPLYEGRREEKLTIRGKFPDSFFRRIRCGNASVEPEERKPFLHFSADKGWINDPNGLVYDGDRYHLYFQYNPFDTNWENMSWGHAVSRDLLHWTQEETVMYPDKEGMMFSGSGLLNDKELLGYPKDALLFFYTAAGSANEWSGGKDFTQRLAVSTDGGRTLQKLDRGTLPTISRENRDPKVFWHEESGSYIMCLWIKDNDFSILRSQDLLSWERTQTFRLDSAWECPDLLKLPVEGGGTQWVFFSADGFYYLGDFDGFEFHADGVRQEAYRTKLPYAAQSYSGVKDRIVSVPWLRTKNKGKLFTGVMGLPRELSLCRKDGVLLLKLSPARECLAARREVLRAGKDELSRQRMDERSDETREERRGRSLRYSLDKEAAVEISIKGQENAKGYWLRVFGHELSYDAGSGNLLADGEEIGLEPGIRDFSFLLDRGVLELTGDYDTIYAAAELSDDAAKGEIEIMTADLEEAVIYEMR